MGEHALIIHLDKIGECSEEIGMDPLDALVALESSLRDVVEASGIGVVDGHEIALDDSEGSLWLYGANAKAMLKLALPVLCPSPLASGGRVLLRYGTSNDEAATEEIFSLADLCARQNS